MLEPKQEEIGPKYKTTPQKFVSSVKVVTEVPITEFDFAFEVTATKLKNKKWKEIEKQTAITYCAELLGNGNSIK